MMNDVEQLFFGIGLMIIIGLALLYLYRLFSILHFLSKVYSKLQGEKSNIMWASLGYFKDEDYLLFILDEYKGNWKSLYYSVVEGKKKNKR